MAMALSTNGTPVKRSMLWSAYDDFLTNKDMVSLPALAGSGKQLRDLRQHLAQLRAYPDIQVESGLTTSIEVRLRQADALALGFYEDSWANWFTKGNGKYVVAAMTAVAAIGASFRFNGSARHKVGSIAIPLTALGAAEVYAYFTPQPRLLINLESEHLTSLINSTYYASVERIDPYLTATTPVLSKIIKNVKGKDPALHHAYLAASGIIAAALPMGNCKIHSSTKVNHDFKESEGKAEIGKGKPVTPAREVTVLPRGLRKGIKVYPKDPKEDPNFECRGACFPIAPPIGDVTAAVSQSANNEMSAMQRHLAEENEPKIPEHDMQCLELVNKIMTEELIKVIEPDDRISEIRLSPSWSETTRDQLMALLPSPVATKLKAFVKGREIMLPEDKRARMIVTTGQEVSARDTAIIYPVEKLWVKCFKHVQCKGKTVDAYNELVEEYMDHLVENREENDNGKIKFYSSDYSACDSTWSFKELGMTTRLIYMVYQALNGHDTCEYALTSVMADYFEQHDRSMLIEFKHFFVKAPLSKCHFFSGLRGTSLMTEIGTMRIGLTEIAQSHGFENARHVFARWINGEKIAYYRVTSCFEGVMDMAREEAENWYEQHIPDNNSSVPNEHHLHFRDVEAEVLSMNSRIADDFGDEVITSTGYATCPLFGGDDNAGEFNRYLYLSARHMVNNYKNRYGKTITCDLSNDTLEVFSLYHHKNAKKGWAHFPKIYKTLGRLLITNCDPTNPIVDGYYHPRPAECAEIATMLLEKAYTLKSIVGIRMLALKIAEYWVIRAIDMGYGMTNHDFRSTTRLDLIETPLIDFYYETVTAIDLASTLTYIALEVNGIAQGCPKAKKTAAGSLWHFECALMGLQIIDEHFVDPFTMLEGLFDDESTRDIVFRVLKLDPKLLKCRIMGNQDASEPKPHPRVVDASKNGDSSRKASKRSKRGAAGGAAKAMRGNGGIASQGHWAVAAENVKPRDGGAASSGRQPE